MIPVLSQCGFMLLQPSSLTIKEKSSNSICRDDLPFWICAESNGRQHFIAEYATFADAHEALHDYVEAIAYGLSFFRMPDSGRRATQQNCGKFTTT